MYASLVGGESLLTPGVQCRAAKLRFSTGAACAIRAAKYWLHQP